MTPLEQVRLLINDPAGNPVFSDDEITAFLELEGASVKRAAAQALETIADDELLTSKVIRSQDLSTNGAALAQQLRVRAAQLRSESGGALSPVGCFPDAPDDRPWR